MRKKIDTLLGRAKKALGDALKAFIANGQVRSYHECDECRHVLPSQRRDWHRGVRRWYLMIGEGRTWE